MQRYKRIELVMNWKLEISWEIARGLRDVVIERGFLWEFFSTPRESFIPALEEDVAAVLVLGLTEPDEIELAQKPRPFPIINISPLPLTPGIPQVDADLYMTGALAAEHLFSLGFTQGVWLGDDEESTLARGQGFKEKMEALGGSARRLVDISGLYGAEHSNVVQKISLALKQLEKPAAVYCVNDDLGRIVIRACQDEQVHIPEEVAVLATQNSIFDCEGVHPYLSSIDVGYREIGRKAAEILHRKLEGKPVPACTLLPPVGVVQRESTNILAIEDERLRKVMIFLRDHYAEKVDLTKLAASVGLSRRGLEYLFQTALHRSPHEEIMHLRFERVKVLLRTTQLVIDSIAVMSGFNSGHYLCDMFKRHEGQTPSAYRKSHFVGGA